MRRIVSVWLPDWPITVWSRKAGRPAPPEGAPFALVERTARGLAILSLNAAARSLGLHMGQRHADACAAAPHLASAPAEPERDRRRLKALAVWAERFSPLVAMDAGAPGMEGLFIDMTGGDHLFGGEAALLADMLDRLDRSEIPARCAIAPTAGAAWALARFSGRAATAVDEGGARDAIASLPVAALRLEASAIALLARFGLKRIGDLYALPRSGLARRFRSEAGLTVVQRLDQALGLTPEPLIPTRAPTQYRTSQVFAEPMMEGAGAAHWLPDMADRLAAQLLRDGKGARRLRLTAFRVDGQASSIEARLSAPSAAPAHLIRLLKEVGLENLDLGFGADALVLSAPVAEPMVARQGDMEASHDLPNEAALAGLIDRLSARLGDGAVLRPSFQESWLPERRARWIAGDRSTSPLAPLMGPRPILLYEPPEVVEAMAELPEGAPARFIWRRVARRIVKAAGPERLSPEWWRGAGERTRDYYHVEDEDGRRYWLFREGLYGREDGRAAPTWRLHGVFL